MTSTTANKKTYRIRFKDGTTTSVLADAISEPRESAPNTKISFYVFSLDGDVVAKYKRQDVAGWQIIYPPSLV